MADRIKSLKLLDSLKESMEKNRISEVKDAVEDLLISRVNVAVVGCRGTEKAAFINSLRGLGKEQEGAAKALSETSPEELAVHCSPKHSDFRIWDVPGVPGATSFSLEEYMERVRFLRFNVVIMATSGNLQPNEVSVWKEARALQKETVYFSLLATEKDSKESLEARRKSSLEVLKAQGITSQKIFVVCPNALEKMDFQVLVEQMQLDLPEIKANTLLIALPAFSISVVQQKKEAFKAVVWAAASLSGGVSTIPVPLVSSMVDVGLATRILSKARDSLDLDDESIGRLAGRQGMAATQLRARCRCSLSAEVTKGEVKKRLAAAENEKPSGSWMAQMALPSCAKSASRSFITMLLALTGAIDEMGVDAEKVLETVLGEGE